MFSRDSAFLYTLLDEPLWFVAGVRLPLFALPVWVKTIGLAFPLTTSLVVLRGALLDGRTVTELAAPLAGLAGLCVVLFAAAAGLLRLGEAHAQRTGSHHCSELPAPLASFASATLAPLASFASAPTRLALSATCLPRPAGGGQGRGMRVLVLGGTGFVGRAVVDEAVARGDDVTTLNRGRRTAAPGVTAVVGGPARPERPGRPTRRVGRRGGHLERGAVRGPRRRDRAGGRTGRYVYVSSRSVYADPVVAGAAEDAPVVEAAPDDGGDVDYARAKRGGELAALAVFGDRAVLARAGLILGPYEDVGRLPWWLTRIARGGPCSRPGRGICRCSTSTPATWRAGCSTSTRVAPTTW
jgi:hypothetical protein